MRVLIVRVGAMGDVLHALPAVTALRRALPDSYLGWAIEPRWQPLIDGQGGIIDRVHPVPTRDWKASPFSRATLRQIVQLRRSLRSERYDLAVDLQGSIRSAVIGRMSGANRFLGPARPRERQARGLYGERVEVQQPHVIGQAAELLSAAVKLHLSPAPVRLPFNDAAERWAAGLGTGFILIAPTAGWGAKEWPAERYGALASALISFGHCVLINASAGEDPAANRIAEASGARIVVSGVAELIALSRRAALVLGGDTGPVHLAAALGRPVLGLFGPTDPARSGPAFPGADAVVLRHPASIVDHRRHLETEAGLMRITVEEVLAAALELLERPQGRMDG